MSRAVLEIDFATKALRHEVVQKEKVDSWPVSRRVRLRGRAVG